MAMELRFCETKIYYWAYKYTKCQRQKDRECELEVIGLRDNIQKRGYLTKEELFLVAYWKSPRKAKLTRENPDGFIEEVTKQAFTSPDDWEKLNSLTRFKGVKVKGVEQPTASAILHHYDKKQYPILDPRALWSAGLERKKRSYYPRRLWLEYIRFCQDIANRNRITMRTLDRALWWYPCDSEER